MEFCQSEKVGTLSDNSCNFHSQTVGLPAKQGLIRNANNTVCNVKHVIGCATDEIHMKEIKQNSSAKVSFV